MNIESYDIIISIQLVNCVSSLQKRRVYSYAAKVLFIYHIYLLIPLVYKDTSAVIRNKTVCDCVTMCCDICDILPKMRFEVFANRGIGVIRTTSS